MGEAALPTKIIVALLWRDMLNICYVWVEVQMQSSKYIFTLYTMEMKRKKGGVAHVAQRKNLDGSEVDKEEPPNMSDINELLSYLGGSIDQEELSGGKVFTPQRTVTTDNNHNEKEMQKLVK
jgi:hypothetical protein